MDIKINKDILESAAYRFWEKSPDKFIPKDGIYAENIGGTCMFEKPIFGYAQASDPIFEKLNEIEVIGPHHIVPKLWLSSAKTVISFFLPFSEQIKEGNSKDLEWPSSEWYHARIDGQRFLSLLASHIADLLVQEGYKAVIPGSRELDDSAYRFKVGANIWTSEGEKVLKYTSNWSQRHVAYISGLGTFGLSKNLITEKGCAGRFGSIITDLQLEPGKKAYQDIYEYCSKCGRCIDHCPAQAISLEKGKDHAKCKGFLDQTKIDPPYYGCGKCQVGLPCSNEIP